MTRVRLPARIGLAHHRKPRLRNKPDGDVRKGEKDKEVEDEGSGIPDVPRKVEGAQEHRRSQDEPLRGGDDLAAEIGVRSPAVDPHET